MADLGQRLALGLVAGLLGSCSPDPQSNALDRLAAKGYDLSAASFHQAAGAGDLEAIEDFLEAGTAIDLPANVATAHATALRRTVQDNQPRAFTLLRERGASLEIADSGSPRLLELAIAADATALVEALAQTESALQNHDKGRLLDLALTESSQPVLEVLIEHLDLPLDAGLLAATRQRRIEALDLLHQAGANPNPATGPSPLHLAVGMGDADLVRLLLGMGAQRFQTDPEGRLPVELALEAGHAALVPLLFSEPRAEEREFSLMPATGSSVSSTRSRMRSTTPHVPGEPRILWALNDSQIGHHSGLMQPPPVPERLQLQTVRPRQIPLRLIHYQPPLALFEDLHQPGVALYAEAGSPIGDTGYRLLEISAPPVEVDWCDHMARIETLEGGQIEVILPGIASRRGPLCAVLHVRETDEFYEAHPGDVFRFSDRPLLDLTIEAIQPRLARLRFPGRDFSLDLEPTGRH